MDRRPFTKEFKEEAVRLSFQGHKPVGAVAEALGIQPNNLWRWRKEYKQNAENAFPGNGKLKPGDEEMRRLKRENTQLREERDILKKALAIFSVTPK